MGVLGVAPSYATPVAATPNDPTPPPRMRVPVLPSVGVSPVIKQGVALVTRLGVRAGKIGDPGPPSGPPPEWSPAKMAAVVIAYGQRQVRAVLADVREFREARRSLIDTLDRMP